MAPSVCPPAARHWIHATFLWNTRALLSFTVIHDRHILLCNGHHPLQENGNDDPSDVIALSFDLEGTKTVNDGHWKEWVHPSYCVVVQKRPKSDKPEEITSALNHLSSRVLSFLFTFLVRWGRPPLPRELWTLRWSIWVTDWVANWCPARSPNCIPQWW